ncbi:MAG: hypothetical protein EBS61_06025 [Betaproteobacteria bacterium]|nr:hypothetical protein [Betaproteobacteria bacterium]
MFLKGIDLDASYNWSFSVLKKDDLWAYLVKKSLHHRHPIPMWFESVLNLPVARLAYGGWANEIT